MMKGLLLNCAFMIVNELIDLNLRFVSLEFNFSFAQFGALGVPIIAVLDEPYPSIALWTVCGLMVLVTSFMKFESKDKLSGKQDITMSIMNSLMTTA